MDRLKSLFSIILEKLLNNKTDNKKGVPLSEDACPDPRLKDVEEFAKKMDGMKIRNTRGI